MVDSQWKTEWPGEIYMAHGSSKSKGVAILIPKNLEHIIVEQLIDKDGRYIILKISMFKETFVLANVNLQLKIIKLSK